MILVSKHTFSRSRNPVGQLRMWSNTYMIQSLRNKPNIFTWKRFFHDCMQQSMWDVSTIKNISNLYFFEFTRSLDWEISDNNVHCRAENINHHYHHLICDCCNACQRHFHTVSCKDKSVHGKFLDLHEQRFDEQFPLHWHLTISTMASGAGGISVVVGWSCPSTLSLW